MNTSSVRAQAQPVIDYPVEIEVPGIDRWRDGNTGTPFVHRISSGQPGPHLLVTALVHGNEPAGAIALDRLLSRGVRPSRGTLTVAFANADAYARFDPTNPRTSRWVDEDMNRLWSPDILGMQPPRTADAARAAALLPFVQDADFLLDLHTTQHPNEPLVLAGPLERSRRLARAIGLADLVMVDRGHAQGPRLRDHGGFGDPRSHKTALLIECGQHWAAVSPAVATAACLRMLDRLNMLPGGFDVREAAAHLPDQASRFVEITMPVTVKREFTFAMPLRGGEIIPKAGTVIGHDGGEPVVTPHDDCVAIMPSQRLWAGLTAVRLGRMVPPPEPAVLPPEVLPMSDAFLADAVEVNGRSYRCPARPTVIVCFDGFDPAYLERGLADGILPALARCRERGFSALAEAVVPSFTNPNNTSIVTGVLPAVHGISGNYYLDRRTGEEVMVTDARLLRCETILGRMSQAGVRVAAVTAKDKLRRMLAHNLRGIAFSSQCAGEATEAENGIAGVEALVGRGTPDQYDPDLSLFVMDAGVRLVECGMAELLYLSLSDLVQHAHAPGEPEADRFHAAVDARIGRLVELGAVVGVVADHGMSDKACPDGSPRVVFLQDELCVRFGAGAARVICPITDPFVRHHGSLGSYVRVYARGGADARALMDATAALPGVELVLTGKSAAARFGLPAEFEGDFAVVSDRGTVIGATAREHNLSGLAGHRLRSHGGLAEQRVPFLLSHPLAPGYRDRADRGSLRNFDIFDFALNGVEGG